MLITFKGKKPQIDPSVFVAEGVKLIGDVHIGCESSVWYNTVLRADLAPIRIGRRCNIQDGSIGHVNRNEPLLVEDEVSVGHGAIIHACTLGKGALIGMGATIMSGVQIGENVLVGAGSLVTENKKIPPHTLVMGSPARVVRELTEEDVQGMKKIVDSYAAKAVEFRTM